MTYLSLVVGADWPGLNQVGEFFVSRSPTLKILAFFTIWFLVWLPIAIPLAWRFQWRPFAPLPIAQKLPLVLSLYAIVPFLLWGVIHLENTSPQVYGLVWSLAELGSLIAGVSLGVGGAGLLFGLESVLGWVEWQPIALKSIVPTLLLLLGLGLIIGAIEESVFRGFLLTQFQQQYSDGLAAVISSLIFAFLHLIWEGKQAGPQLPGLGLMGLVLVLARWVDEGNLGLAWGLHAGWVWAMASLDAAQVIRPRDDRSDDRSPVWLTGFAGQPLAGGMGLLMLLLTGSILWGFHRVQIP